MKQNSIKIIIHTLLIIWTSVDCLGCYATYEGTVLEDAGADSGVSSHGNQGMTTETPLGEESPPSGDYCYAERWEGPEQPRTGSICSTVAPSVAYGFKCECDGEPALNINIGSDSEACADALAETCGVDPRVKTFCGFPTIGACFRGSLHDMWTCHCTDNETPVDTEASECLDALTEACAEKCEGLLGSCHRDLERWEGYSCTCDWHESVDSGSDAAADDTDGGTFGADDGYTFEFTSDSGPAGIITYTPPSPVTCEEAVQLQCRELCSDAAGACVLGEGERFACTCQNGSQIEVDYDENLGREACETALRSSCGAVAYAPIE